MKPIPKPINWNLLAKRAFEHGRRVAHKASDNKDAHTLKWTDLPNSSHKGFLALVKFVAKELKKL